MELKKLSRRDFFRLTGVAGGSLLVAASLPYAGQAGDSTVFSPSVWLQIEPSGQIVIWNKIAEMGQGSRSSLAMIIADELDADWRDVEIRQAPSTEAYGVHWTGGSDAVLAAWKSYRTIGAAARQMLVRVAADKFGVRPETLQTKASMVTDPSSGKRLSYASLSEAASLLPLPKAPKLKEKSEFTLLGQQKVQRKEICDIVTGTAQYGMETRLPNMRYAAIIRAPVLGAKLVKFDASQALASPGVEKVFAIKGNDFPAYDHIRDGIAIIATSTWHAFSAMDKVDAEWTEGIDANLSSQSIDEQMNEKLSQEGVTGRVDGDIGTVIKHANMVLEAEYDLPFLAHAPMEPMNATAWVKGDKIEIWTPTQRATRLQEAVAKRFGIDKFNVVVHTPLLGGSFGRRLDVDYGIEASIVATQTSFPVQLVWRREDDMQFAVYRSASKHRLRASISDGQLTGVEHKASHLSVWQQQEPDRIKDGYDRASAAPQAAWPYPVENFYTSQHLVDAPVQVGWLRGVYGTNHTLVQECWLDEIADALQKDPIDFRIQLLSQLNAAEQEKDKAQRLRLLSLVKTAQQASLWHARKERAEHLGFACDVFAGMTYVAVVVEARKTVNADIHIHKLDCYIDCGAVVNPDMIRAQFEGGAMWALSALQSAVTIENGIVQESNFDAYIIPRMDSAPFEVNVHIVDCEEPPMGVGEPVVTATMPAMLNAISSLIGKRQRKLPISFA